MTVHLVLGKRGRPATVWMGGRAVGAAGGSVTVDARGHPALGERLAAPQVVEGERVAVKHPVVVVSMSAAAAACLALATTRATSITGPISVHMGQLRRDIRSS